MYEIIGPLRVVSPTTGKPMLEVTEDDGCISLALYNRAGQVVAGLTAENEAGDGEMWLNHGDGSIRISVEAHKSGGSIFLNNAPGSGFKGSGLLLASHDGEGGVVLGRGDEQPFAIGYAFT